MRRRNMKVGDRAGMSELGWFAKMRRERGKIFVFFSFHMTRSDMETRLPFRANV